MTGLTAETRKPANFAAYLIGSIVFFSIGNLNGWITPPVLFGIIDRFEVPAAQAGLVSLLEGGIAGILSIVLGLFDVRFRFRTMLLVAMLFYIAINAISFWVDSFYLLLALRGVNGLAEGVLVYATIALVAARSANPDSSYASMNIAANAYGAVVVGALPYIWANATGLAYFLGSAVAGLALLPFLFSIPGKAVPTRMTHPHATEGVAPSRLGLLVVLLVFAIAQGFMSFSIFTFSPGIGERLGMSHTQINTMLGAATLASLIGPFLAGALPKLMGRIVPFVIILIMFFVANYLSVTTQSQSVLVICSAINLAASFFFVPMMTSVCAIVDASGRYASIIMGTYIVMAAASPVPAGFLVDHFGFDGLIYVVYGATAVMTLLSPFVLVRLPKHSSNAAAIASAEG